MKAQYFLIALTIVTIFFIFELFNPFLKPIIVALLLAVATNSLNVYLKKFIPNPFVSSTLMTILLTAIFFVPVLYCIFSFASLINKIDQQALIKIYEVTLEWVQNMPEDFNFIKEQLIKLLN